MQSLRASILRYMRIRPKLDHLIAKDLNTQYMLNQHLCTNTPTSISHNQVMDRVVMVVKKFDKLDGAKVTETTDFQKDLSLDSLDRVELVMALEQEFAIEIPDEEADKLKCCGDVAKYIMSHADQKAAETT